MSKFYRLTPFQVLERLEKAQRALRDIQEECEHGVVNTSDGRTRVATIKVTALLALREIEK